MNSGYLDHVVRLERALARLAVVVRGFLILLASSNNSESTRFSLFYKKSALKRARRHVSGKVKHHTAQRK